MEGSSSQAGFYYQNNIAALKIIESLFFESDIKYIQLENYDRGNHIDDIIINRENITEFIQVKWSEDDEKNYTLYNLLSKTEDKKSLFRQLADGFKSVKNAEDDFQIFLYSTKGISNALRPSKNIKVGLKDFLQNILASIQSADDSYEKVKSIKQYQPLLEIVRKETGLTKNEFNDFLNRLFFQLKQEPLYRVKDAIEVKFNLLGIEKKLIDKLLTSVVEWSISGEKITKEKVLKQLDLFQRFEDKLSHFFKIVDEKYYVGNEQLLKSIKSSIDELKGGYILIEGLPGIGKSTALTKFQQQQKEIAFTYYCFIPDSRNNFGELRHKSNYFLKSMCVGIENRFPQVDFPYRYSDDYESKLSAYIDELSKLNRKIIFVIDGLDHVHRDLGFSENSLLTQIKGKLPDNIFIIVSTQYKSVLSESVIQQINLDSRRYIVAKGFTQRKIKEYLTNKGIDNSEILGLVEKVSSGIPLYLHYISELLLKVDKYEYKDVLKKLPRLSNGEIDTYHEYLYSNIEFSEYAKWVLTFLAYRKENTSIELINEILQTIGVDTDIIKVKEVMNSFSHLLKRNDSGNYSIFHNSFREFILFKTGDIKNKFSEALINYYEQNPDSDESYRNYFSLLYDTENFSKILTTISVDWIKTAWQNLRPFNEIKHNVEIAHNAAVEVLNLSEFIRISFLKARVLNIEWNLDNSNIDFPTLFLKAGRVKNSLRALWDGDFLLGSKEYFYHYLSLYHLKFNKLLPATILSQGLGKATINSSYDSLLQSLKADILIDKNPVTVFEAIDRINWKKDDNHRRDFKKTDYSKKRNNKINSKIKEKLINYLLLHKEYGKLSLLKEANLNDERIAATNKIALAKFFIEDDKETALDILKQIDFKHISKNKSFRLISHFSSFLTFKEIIEYFPKPEISLPDFENKIVEQGQMIFKLKDDIVSLFELLKVVWVFEPKLIKKAELRISILSDPALGIYNSILNLSELWKNIKTTKITDSAKLTSLKKSLKELYIKHPKYLQKRSFGLFDMDSDGHFIGRSLYKINNIIFQLALEQLSENDLKLFIDYWFELEESKDGYRHHKVGIEFAKIINKKYRDSFKAELLKIIEHSEALVRQDEDTATLLEHLGEIAETYGVCNFQEQFVKLYNEFIVIAFGIGHRKDYQASYITSALEAIHKTNKENSLNRLQEVLSIQTQLAYAGNGRMNHICKSDLISFTGKYFPGLAFTLLDHEENNIGRNEAISIVLKPFIDKASKEEIPLLFGVLKTIPRWNTGGTSKGEFLDLSVQLLTRVIEIGYKNYLPVILKEVKFNIMVELEEPDKFEEFYIILKKNGLNPTDFSLPEVEFKKEKDEKGTYRGKFLSPFLKLDKEHFLELFNRSYEDFDKELESLLRVRIENNRRVGIRNEFYTFKNNFEDFYKSISTPQQKKLNGFQVIRYFLEFRDEIVNLESNSYIEKEEIAFCFKSLCSKIDKKYPDVKIREYIEKECDVNKLIDEIQKNINDSREHIISSILSDEDISEIISKVSILKLEAIEDFLEKWVTGNNYSKAILTLANRLVRINPEKAKQMLDVIAEKEYDNLLFSNQFTTEKLGFNVIETFIKADEEFGKRYLLKSFISQKGRYSYELLSSIDKLTEYEPYFPNENVAESYFDANLEYNMGLAEGLPNKPVDYSFVKKYDSKIKFSEVIVDYMINLFDYPVIKVRELALQAVFDMLIENPKYIETILKRDFKKLSYNEIEHILTVLISLASVKPDLLIKFKKDLWSFALIKHFNINQLLKSLLSTIEKYDRDFLKFDEKLKLKNLNQPSSLIIPKELKIYEKGGRFLHSEFQADVLYLITKNDLCDVSIQEEIYTDLKQNKNLGNYDVENEGIVHQNYNINTNFDTIEIHSNYYEEVKNSLNEILYKKIKRSFFEPKFIDDISLEFRLYDPTNLLYKPVIRPDYINWLPQSSPEDFMRFEDLENISESFIHREKDYITLFESGSQRLLEGYRETKFSSYFEVYAFLKKKDIDKEFDSLQYDAIIAERNQFAFEMPNSIRNFNTFPVKGILPILEVSRNTFRGEKHLSTAIIAKEFYKMLNYGQLNLSDLLQATSEAEKITAIHWQNAYTSGRRRYKPSSEGFSLKIKKSFLKIFLEKNNFDLCLNFEVSRSNTPYVNESHMKWENFEKTVIVKI